MSKEKTLREKLNKVRLNISKELIKLNSDHEFKIIEKEYADTKRGLMKSEKFLYNIINLLDRKL